MSNETLDKLVWVLLYGGIVGVMLGLYVGTAAPVFGWTCKVGGAAAVALGVVAFVVRARRRDDA